MIADWLAHRATAMPGRTALVAAGRTWSFAELDADVTRLAHRLASHGVRSGDRVATLLANGPWPAMIVHAMLRLGAVIVPLNTRLTDAELAWQVGDVGPCLLVVDTRNASRAGAVLGTSSGVEVHDLDVDTTPSAFGAPDPGTSPVRAVVRGTSATGLLATGAMAQAATPPAGTFLDPEAVLAIIYTSGTTGQPKGAMLTVGNFWWSAIGSALNLGTHADDRWLACLPLFHVGGLSIVLRAAIGGFAAVVHDGFDAATINRAIDEDRITTISLVGVMLQRMLDARGDTPYPRSLRTVLVGGGPVPRPLLDRCIALGVPVVQTYGLTETASQVVTLSHSDVLHRLGAAGRALYPNRIRIRLSDRDAAPGEAGQILVQGPVVMAGYAGRPEESARAIVDGWLHTGDIGYMDRDGFLFVLDRRDDLIITGGENVYPAEVESVILAYPGIAEAGVIGLSDTTWGQRVVAIIRCEGGRAPDIADTLRAHCRTRLAGYKVPSEFRIVTEPLPRTASGKLRRGALSAREASRS